MRSLLVLIALALSLNSPARAQVLFGSGSTLCYPLLTAWAEAYGKITGTSLIYQPIGSAAGITEIRHAVVDFAVSEAPLDDAALLRDGLAQFPLVIGAVVPVVNLAGIGPGSMRLSGPVLADIYLGRIRKWNDAAIAGLNPGLKLPDLAIVVVHRSDGSGTSFIWGNYLSRVSKDWKARVGEGTTLAWPTGFGAKGNGGVAEKLAKAPGAIGYIDYAYATKRNLTYIVVSNKAGQFVAPDMQSMATTTEGMDWQKDKDFNVSLNDRPQENAYPIMAISFVIMRRYPVVPERTRALLDFMAWLFVAGRDTASAQHYLPLPPPLLQQIQDYWRTGLLGS